MQFGSGTRKFFDYLLSIISEDGSNFTQKVNISLNKELESVLDEIL